MATSLNLIVLRCSDLGKSENFYRRLGLSFTTHQHGSGVAHLACEMPGCVLELYPLSIGTAPSSGARLGFSVPSMSQAMEAFAGTPDVVVMAPKPSEWGLRAVLVDPDGHKVEIVEA